MLLTKRVSLFIQKRRPFQKLAQLARYHGNVRFYAGLSGDNDDNETLLHKRMKSAVRFAYYTLGAVALYRVAAAFRNGYPEQGPLPGIVAHCINGNILSGKTPALAVCPCEQVIFLQHNDFPAFCHFKSL